VLTGGELTSGDLTGGELTGIVSRIERTLAGVERIGALVASIAADADAGGRALCREDIGPIRLLATELLREHPGFIAGAGAVLAPGVLADAPQWLEWWWAETPATVQRLRVDLDPASADYSDYTTTEWYRTPERRGRWSIIGPYVDYICTHQYTFTLSAPVRCAGRFIGVAGADILAAQVERLALPALHAQDTDAVLVSAAGRVIASTAAAVTPGMIAPPGQVIADLGTLPWQVRSLTERPRRLCAGPGLFAGQRQSMVPRHSPALPGATEAPEILFRCKSIALLSWLESLLRNVRAAGVRPGSASGGAGCVRRLCGG
jgi:hypothetical protein